MHNVSKVMMVALLALPVEFALAANPANDASDTSTMQSSPADKSGGVKQRVMEWMLTDKKFVEKAGEGGRAEIELSKLALQKAQTQQVREFAQKMVDDHTMAAQELDTIAKSKNLQVPIEMDNSHQKDLSRLQKLDGAQFDAAYIDMMRKDHDKDVSLFAAAADDKKLDPQLQSFAQKTLPTLKSHQQHAQSLNAGNVSSSR